MPGITQKVSIAAPPETVFAAASEFAGAPGRIQGIKKIEMLTQGPVGVGTRFRETRVMFGREATETMEVLAFDPPRSYVLGAKSCGCEYRTSFEFRRTPSGTDLEARFEAKPLTFMGRVMSFIFAPMIKSCAKAFAKDLADLKAHCEKQGAAAS